MFPRHEQHARKDGAEARHAERKPDAGEAALVLFLDHGPLQRMSPSGSSRARGGEGEWLSPREPAQQPIDY